MNAPERRAHLDVAVGIRQGPSSALGTTPPDAAPSDAALLAAVRASLAATAGEIDREARFPHENFALLQRHGLIGAVADRRHGGAGLGLSDAARIIAAVAGGEAATALVLVMTYIQHRLLDAPDSRWPEALRSQVALSAVDQGALINALRVEPALGSPSRGGLPATIARRVGDGWRLSGRKIYSTGSPALAWMTVWARTEEVAPRLGVFLVPAGLPGIRIEETWDHLGLRASGSHDVVFEDVALPLDHAVDLRFPDAWSPGATETAANTQAAWAAVLLGALYDAIAREAADWLRGFLRTRTPAGLGRPLASLPRMQEQVGEIEGLLWTNRLLIEQVATAVDQGEVPSAADSGLLKHVSTNNAIRVVELALQISGNHGLSRLHPLERHHRDVLCSRIHTPQTDAILQAAGRAALHGDAEGR